MRRTRSAPLSQKEIEAIAEIDAYRRDVRNGVIPGPLKGPEHIMHSLIAANHGHVTMRLQSVTPALGVTSKTLQRKFSAAYGMSMSDYQMEVRIKHARDLLSRHPRPKLSFIASELGYSDPREFARKFREHMKVIPSKWTSEDGDREMDEQ